MTAQEFIQSINDHIESEPARLLRLFLKFRNKTMKRHEWRTMRMMRNEKRNQ